MKQREKHPSDLSGMTFGRLTAIRPDHYDEYGRVVWLCACECGTIKPISRQALLYGRTKSCGCLRRETSTITAAEMRARKVCRSAEDTARIQRQIADLKKMLRKKQEETTANYGEPIKK